MTNHCILAKCTRHSHHFIHKFLNGVMVTDIYGIKVDGEIDVGPHVVIFLHMILKSLRKDHTMTTSTGSGQLTFALRSNSWFGRLHMKQNDFLSCSVRN